VYLLCWLVIAVLAWLIVVCVLHVDELGSGTDLVEGAALGQALLKQLIKGRLGL
jgi:hypothetical protein